MSDDFNPPYVFDETPLDTPLQEKAGIFARRFLNAAQQFRNPSGKLERLHLGNERYAEYPAGLHEKCGTWIIQAHKAGLIPEGQKELRGLIDWYVAAGSIQPGRQAVRVRCPSNLFSDLCGGNLVTGTFRGVDERGRVILEDNRVAGGLMPRRADGHLELSHNERCAATCEWLADLIEHAAAPPTATKQSEGGVLPADPFAALRQFARDKLKGQERAVIEALCDAGGEMPIADLASKDGVGWDDEFQGFKDVQRRLNPKIKAEKWEVRRQNNAAILKALKRR